MSNSSPIFKYEMTILEWHLDTFGHVNNAKYLEIFEQARWEIVTANGLGLEQIQKSGIGPVVLELHTKFLKELRLRQRITVFTQLQNYAEKIGTIKQWIENESSQICCEFEMIFGLFDLKQRKLIEPPAPWKTTFGF